MPSGSLKVTDTWKSHLQNAAGSLCTQVSTPMVAADWDNLGSAPQNNLLPLCKSCKTNSEHKINISHSDLVIYFYSLLFFYFKSNYSVQALCAIGLHFPMGLQRLLLDKIIIIMQKLNTRKYHNSLQAEQFLLKTPRRLHLRVLGSRKDAPCGHQNLSSLCFISWPQTLLVCLQPTCSPHAPHQTDFLPQQLLQQHIF